MQHRLECRGLWPGRGTEVLHDVSLTLGQGRVRAIEPGRGPRGEGFVLPAFVDAHWHLFWAGKGRTEPRVHWLPPIPVNVSAEEEPTVVVHPVATE